MLRDSFANLIRANVFGGYIFTSTKLWLQSERDNLSHLNPPAQKIQRRPLVLPKHYKKPLLKSNCSRRRWNRTSSVISFRPDNKPAIVVGSLSKDHVQATLATSFQRLAQKNLGPELILLYRAKATKDSAFAGAIGLILSAATGIIEQGINPARAASYSRRTQTSALVYRKLAENFEAGYGKLNSRRAIDAYPNEIFLSLRKSLARICSSISMRHLVNLCCQCTNPKYPVRICRMENRLCTGINAEPEEFEPVAQGSIIQGEAIDASTEIPTNGLFSDITSPPLAGTHALSIRSQPT